MYQDPNNTPNSGGGGANIGGAVIGGAVDLINSAAARKTSRRNTDAVNTANQELAQYSYEKNLEMWEMQNLYNSPSAQMQRLKAAGLNPNLIYKQGATHTASSPPAYDTPKAVSNVTPLQIPKMIALYQNFQMRSAQIDNVQAQTDNVKARTINESITSQLGKQTYGRRGQLEQYQVESARQGAIKSATDVKKAMQELRNLSEDEKLKLLLQKYQRANITGRKIQNEKLQAEAIFQQYKNKWIKMGITTSDSLYLRIITRMINESGLNLQKLFDGVNMPRLPKKEDIKDFFNFK